MLDDNDCGRFQCYFTSVQITKSPAIMLHGMEDSILGIWTSHGEGKMTETSEASSLEVYTKYVNFDIEYTYLQIDDNFPVYRIVRIKANLSIAMNRCLTRSTLDHCCRFVM
jgi:phosphoribosylformylglycinamidine (FGAM) synthase-like amidotransferase family enzyme